VQDPSPNRPTDLTNSPQRDLPAGQEAHLTPLIHAGVSDREPEPGARHRAHAHVDPGTHAARQTATRGLAATKNPTHPASAAHIAAALGQEITETAGCHPRMLCAIFAAALGANGQDRSANACDKLYLLPDAREPGQ
jgi:hypothetical protein